MKRKTPKSGLIEEKPDKAKPKKEETISSTRINPDDVFGAVAEKKEFIEEGKWLYKIEDVLYSDVLRAAYLEGFLVTKIEGKEDHIEIEVTELQ